MIISISGEIGSGKDTFAKVLQYVFYLRKRKKAIDDGAIASNPLNLDKYFELNEGLRQTNSDWQIRKFAGKLKQYVADMIGVPMAKIEDQEFKRSELGPEWDYFDTKWIHPNEYEGRKEAGEDMSHWELNNADVYYCTEKKKMTVRLLLQLFGTEGVRNHVHPNAWVNALLSSYKPTMITPKKFGQEITWEEPKWIVTDTRFPNEADALKEKGAIMVRMRRALPESLQEGKHTSETALNDYPFNAIIENNGIIEGLIPQAEYLISRYNL